MTQPNQVDALEQAIQQRAKALSDEHLIQAKRARQRIQQECLERLHLMEEKEILVAKAKAERECRRIVQASEIRMQAELDRLRWGLVQSVLESLRSRLVDIHNDQVQYLPMLKQLLVQAASAIEREELVARLCDSDHRVYGQQWEQIASEAVPNKRITLSSEAIPCSGGVIVMSHNERISIDNTFEGRMERLEPQLHQVVLERLFPSTARMEVSLSG